MIVTNTSLFPPVETPPIDAAEARWAADELARLMRRLGPDSPVTMVLRQARREVASLAASPSATVVGPFRAAA
jgi:hypothetical protein